jgi:hypothetical protein
MTRRILARSGRQTQRATQVRRKPRTPDRGSLECGGSLLAPGFAPPVQAKLHVGQANDSLEAEADRVAEQVTRSTSVGAAGEIRADPPRISRLAQTAAPAADAAPPAVEAAIDRMSSSGGSPLDGNARARLEPGFGRDLGAVRVHSDAAAHQAAADLDARAFTVGRDIFFAPGEYRPDSVDGDRLLAHELTHVVQQRSGPVDGTPTGDGIAVSHPSDRFEQEAEATASSLGPTGDSPASAQREAEEDEEPVQALALQRQEAEEDEEMQALPLQRQEAEEDEEMQALPLQRQEAEEDEEMQALPLQRQEAEEDEEMPA